jgi:magnesium transporter
MQTFRPEEGVITPCGRGEGNIQWLSASNEEDRQELFKSSHFKRYDLESSLDPDEISRVDFEEDLVVIIVKRPKRATIREGIRFEVSSVGIFLEPDKLTFVTSGEPIEFGSKPIGAECSLLDVVLRFLALTTHNFLAHLKVIKLISAEIQSNINTAKENKYLLQMFALVESLIYYRNAIESNEAMLLRFKVSANKLKLSERQSEYLTDIVMENEQSIKQSTIYSDVLSGMMDARGNIINNNVNALLRKLTLINVIFLPMNLLASIGGMSEYSMMTKFAPWWISYPLFIVGLTLVGWMCWVFIVRVLDKPSQ